MDSVHRELLPYISPLAALGHLDKVVMCWKGRFPAFSLFPPPWMLVLHPLSVLTQDPLGMETFVCS